MTSERAAVQAIATFFGARPPRRLGVAVSGGSDSLALLHLLQDWGKAKLEAVTVDHRLRPTSASEALHVARLCEGIGIPHRTVAWQGWDGKGNLQAEARRTRYALLADWAREQDLDAVALGHTRDDQAETVLMRLSREAGVDGLSGMAARVTRHGVQFCRPLLGQRRDALRTVLASRGVRWIDDPSNEDESFERVRARRALSAMAEFGIETRALAAAAENLAEARDALSVIAAEFSRDHARIVAGDVVFDRSRLNRLPRELRRRLLAGAIRWVASSDHPPRREPMAAAEDACREIRNVTLQGCLLLVSDMTVRVAREFAAVASSTGVTDAPWDKRWTLDGPHGSDLAVRALGEAVRDCPNWRDTGVPRMSLLASPSVWRGDALLAAPVAGFGNGWTATTRGGEDFAASLIAH